MSGDAGQTTSDRTVVTDKELNYIKDFLSWELLAMKKCAEAASGVASEEIRTLIRQTGSRHMKHYEDLLTLLQ